MVRFARNAILCIVDVYNYPAWEPVPADMPDVPVILA
jgi:hypothetical protein